MAWWLATSWHVYYLIFVTGVVIIDDHPEVGDDTNLLCGTDDGFQEVTSKKRHKVMIENEVKKLKKEVISFICNL